jgi:2-dehydropantoate 2-reductase
MNVLVIGAGAVGGFLGASLALSDNQVTLVARQTAAQLIARTGLRLSRPGKRDARAKVDLVTSVRQAFLEGQTYDLVILAVKSYDVVEAVNPIAAFCPQPYPPIMTVQNGIGIERLVAESLEGASIVAASLTTPISQQAPAHVRVEHDDRGLALAPTAPKQAIKPWVALFNEANIETVLIKDHEAMTWSKALLNMIGNATSAIINRHPSAIYKYGPTYELEMEMLREALDVMDAKKLEVVDLPGTATKRLAFAVRRLPKMMVQPILSRIVGAGRGNKMPSFHIDLTSGKAKNEVLYHNGAVAAAGNQLGVPTPVNMALADILLKMARGTIDWKQFDGNPQRLLEAVDKYRD